MKYALTVTFTVEAETPEDAKDILVEELDYLLGLDNSLYEYEHPTAATEMAE